MILPKYVFSKSLKAFQIKMIEAWYFLPLVFKVFISVMKNNIYLYFKKSIEVKVYYITLTHVSFSQHED